jgi:DNA invertase Pin-like site-specific DNA recombinase
MPTLSSTLTPCIIYAARSREDDRSEEQKSTTSQTEEVRAAVLALGGREVVGEFAESGHSGFHAERGPELVAACDAAKAASCGFDGEAELWVFHSSRLARGSGEKGKQSLMKIWSDLKYEDVQVRSADKADDEFMVNPMLVGIASSQNHKAAQDISAHVSRGKRSAVKLGKWTGGPAPDGYWLEKVVVDNSTETLLQIDAERRPIIEAIYKLSEEGVGDSTIARRLNEAGHRTRKGKAWTRRLVQYILCHPVYAGRIVRVGEGSHKGGTYRKLDTPEVYEGRHEAIIAPERWDAIHAKRAKRDRSKAGREKAAAKRDKGGAPTTRYLLTKLAYCPRCGERMLCKTDPYVRKDGTRKRNYICPNKLGCTGACDLPRIDAGMVDASVWVYLNKTFVDVESWARELQRGVDERRTALESALAHEQAEAVKVERLQEKAQARYRKLIGEDADPTRVEALMAELEDDLAGARDRAATAQERLDALSEEAAPTDTALDFCIELTDAIGGAKESESVQTVNEKLREVFECFYLDVDAEGAVLIKPVMQVGAETLTLTVEAEEFGYAPAQAG